MIAAFVPDVSVWGVGLQGLVLFALYCLGMVGALVVAWDPQAHDGQGREPHADARAAELPPAAHRRARARPLAARLHLSAEGEHDHSGAHGLPLGADDLSGRARRRDRSRDQLQLRGMLGRALEPLFEPIGFNWQMCISLVPAMGAREVAVSVLGTLYATASDAEDALVPILQHSWTIPMGLSFLAFFVFSPSCFATLAAIKREMGTWEGAGRPVGGLHAPRLRLLLRRLPHGPLGLRLSPERGAVEGQARTIRAPAADAAGARIVFRTASR